MYKLLLTKFESTDSMNHESKITVQKSRKKRVLTKI